MGRYVIVLFLQVVVLFISFQTGESIKCYICNSKMDAKCKDPIDKAGLEPSECSPSLLSEVTEHLKKGLKNLASFMKIDPVKTNDNTNLNFACQKIDLSESSGETMTMRTCTLAKSESVDPCAMSEGFSKLTDGKAKVDFCETCDSDLCNGSNHNSGTTLLLLVVPCFAAVLSRWFSI